MKTLAAAAFAAMIMVSGCQKSTTTPLPTPDSSNSADALTPADAGGDNPDALNAPDLATEEGPDADVAQQIADTDTASGVADVVDAPEVALQVDTGPDPDTASGNDAIYIADAGSPTCADKYGPMPMPGQPCSKLGEVRCSDYGALDWNLPVTPGTSLCIRPNRVVCGAGPTGTIVWLLSPCVPTNMEACKTPNTQAACFEYPDGAVCAPRDPLGAYVCPPDQIGNKDCVATGTDSMYSCRKPSDPAGDDITNKILKSEYAWLNTCCPDCRFWLPWQLCPKVNVCDCKEVPLQNCPNGASDRHACIENLNGGAPGCATNCTEIQQWSGWDEGFK